MASLEAGIQGWHTGSRIWSWIWAPDCNLPSIISTLKVTSWSKMVAQCQPFYPHPGPDMEGRMSYVRSLLSTSCWLEFSNYWLAARGSGNCSLLAEFIALCVQSITESWWTLCNPLDYSPLGSSVHGIFQARNWSGLPYAFPGDSPNSGIKPASAALEADSLLLNHWGSQDHSSIIE